MILFTCNMNMINACLWKVAYRTMCSIDCCYSSVVTAVLWLWYAIVENSYRWWLPFLTKLWLGWLVGWLRWVMMIMIYFILFRRITIYECTLFNCSLDLKSWFFSKTSTIERSGIWHRYTFYSQNRDPFTLWPWPRDLGMSNQEVEVDARGRCTVAQLTEILTGDGGIMMLPSRPFDEVSPGLFIGEE